jgi:hypothetical protein
LIPCEGNKLSALSPNKKISVKPRLESTGSDRTVVLKTKIMSLFPFETLVYRDLKFITVAATEMKITIWSKRTIRRPLLTPSTFPFTHNKNVGIPETKCSLLQIWLQMGNGRYFQSAITKTTIGDGHLYYSLTPKAHHTNDEYHWYACKPMTCSGLLQCGRRVCCHYDDKGCPAPHRQGGLDSARHFQVFV